MKSKSNFSITLCGILFAVTLITGCGNSEEHNEMEMEETGSQIDSSIIRDFGVDVASLDENEDGQVYQCPMHFQVISDDAGNCPICSMELKEYTINEAQNNLNKK